VFYELCKFKTRLKKVQKAKSKELRKSSSFLFFLSSELGQAKKMNNVVSTVVGLVENRKCYEKYFFFNQSELVCEAVQERVFPLCSFLFLPSKKTPYFCPSIFSKVATEKTLI